MNRNFRSWSPERTRPPLFLGCPAPPSPPGSHGAVPEVPDAPPASTRPGAGPPPAPHQIHHPTPVVRRIPAPRPTRSSAHPGLLAQDVKCPRYRGNSNYLQSQTVEVKIPFVSTFRVPLTRTIAEAASLPGARCPGNAERYNFESPSANDGRDSSSSSATRDTEPSSFRGRYGIRHLRCRAGGDLRCCADVDLGSGLARGLRPVSDGGAIVPGGKRSSGCGSR